MASRERTERASDAAFAPADPSLDIRFAWRPNRYVLGATWAFVCGSLASGPGWPDLDLMARLVVAWFVAVPLLGRLWRDLIDPAGIDSVPLPRPTARLARFAPALRQGAGWQLLLVAALLWTLEPGAMVAMVAVLAAWVLSVLRRGRLPARDGWERGLAEIWCPAIIAWRVTGGGARIDANLQVAAGNLLDLAHWWLSVWPAAMLFAAFAIVYRASIADRDGPFGTTRRQQIVVGQLLGLATLAGTGSPVATAFVAMLFVLQWPYQVELDTGRSRWVFHATQGMTMLAMLIAAIGLSRGA